MNYNKVDLMKLLCESYSFCSEILQEYNEEQKTNDFEKIFTELYNLIVNEKTINEIDVKTLNEIKLRIENGYTND